MNRVYNKQSLMLEIKKGEEAKDKIIDIHADGVINPYIYQWLKEQNQVLRYLNTMTILMMTNFQYVTPYYTSWMLTLSMNIKTPYCWIIYLRTRYIEDQDTLLNL